MVEVIIAACRHLPSHYGEHTEPRLLLQRQRIVLALEPEKSALERELVQAGVRHEVWDLSLARDNARIARMQQKHREVIRRHIAPAEIVCFSSTWIRAANTAGLSRQALCEDYSTSPIYACRLLDAALYRDLSAVPEYAALHAAYVQRHGAPPTDPAFLGADLSIGSSPYNTWLNGKRFVAGLLDDPVRTLRSWGYTPAPDTRRLLVMAYSHKEIWEQMVIDAYPNEGQSFDGSLSPGEILFLIPEDTQRLRLHLPESTLPPAGLPRSYFRN
ncbi:MAG: hypothetical protein ABIH03_15875 [Pseudomonadota bacterium]